MAKPRCMQCDDRPVRRLKLPGVYGTHAYFCSLRCAAIEGMERPVVTLQEWCPVHDCWYEGACWDCDNPEDA